MRDGAVVHHGTPAEIMTGPVIRAVYDMDVEIQDVRGHRISNYYL
jgi:iron complex transport system ATP-binding protein